MNFLSAKSTNIKDDVRWLVVLFGVLVVLLLPAVISSRAGFNISAALFTTMALIWGMVYIVSVITFVCYDIICEREPQSRVFMPSMAGCIAACGPAISSMLLPPWHAIMTYEALIASSINLVFFSMFLSFIVFVFVRVRKTIL